MSLSPSEGLSTLRLVRLEAGSGLPNLSLLLVTNTRSKSAVIIQNSLLFSMHKCLPCSSCSMGFHSLSMGKQLFHSNWQDVQNLPLFFKLLLIRQIHYY